MTEHQNRPRVPVYEARERSAKGGGDLRYPPPSHERFIYLPIRNLGRLITSVRVVA